MALSTIGDNSLISIVGGDTHNIPSGKEILDAGGEGLPCRGGVFNVVRVDVVGIPNDADFFRVLPYRVSIQIGEDDEFGEPYRGQ